MNKLHEGRKEVERMSQAERDRIHKKTCKAWRNLEIACPICEDINRREL